MFSTLPLLAHQFTNHTFYIPQNPSPLSSSFRPSALITCNGHVPELHRNPTSSPTTMMNRNENMYSNRIAKANPLIHNRDDGRETRRKLFLKKVRQESEDRRWDSRGGEDEMMRTIWIAEEKRRAESRARDAFYVSLPQEEEESQDDIGLESAPIITDSKDEEMADAVARQEAAEVEALLSMMEKYESGHSLESYGGPNTPYFSDDEEYDQIFLEVIKDEETRSKSIAEEIDNRVGNDQDMMDTT